MCLCWVDDETVVEFYFREHIQIHIHFFLSVLFQQIWNYLALHHGHAMGSAKQTALFPLQLQGKDSAESHRRTKLSSASPIYSMQIKISADVLSPVRKNGQFTVFEDKVNISFTNEPDASFDLHDPFIKVIPDLDSMLVLGGRGTETNAHDVYVFARSSQIRQKCVDVMGLLGFPVMDEYGRLILRRRITTSNSMPNLPALNIIWEA